MNRTKIIIIVTIITILTPVAFGLASLIGVQQNSLYKDGLGINKQVYETLPSAIMNYYSGGALPNIPDINTGFSRLGNETWSMRYWLKKNGSITEYTIWVLIMVMIAEVIIFIPNFTYSIIRKLKNKLIYNGEKWLD